MITAVSVLVLAVGYGVVGHFYKFEMYDAAMEMEASMSNLVEKQIDISIGQISYYDNQNLGKPKILLIHGFAAYKENWVRFARPLKEDFHVVAMDLPGHGKSVSKIDLDYSLLNQVSWIKEFTKKIGFDQFHMTGNSMGGAITAVYAATNGDDLISATLLDPAGVHDHRSVMQDLIDKGDNPLVVENHEDFNRLMDFALEQQPFVPWPITEVSAHRAKSLKEVHDKLWLDMNRDQDDTFKLALTAITTPTQVQWGEQDRVLNYKNIEVFAKHIANIETHVWPNVGHAPMVEIPKQSAQLMVEHIANL